MMKNKEIYDYCKPKLEYIRERFIEAKLPYAFLFDIILSVQMDWRTVHDESIPLGRIAHIAFTFLIVGTLVRFFYFEKTGLQNRVNFREKTIAYCQSIVPLWFAMRYRWSRSRCINP